MGDPRISVLIPTYRRPWFLREAVQSVLAQEGVDFELVVADDGCLGADVVAGFADPRITYIAHPTRLGLAGNWNFLLDAARARYVALLMDDDRYLPGFLASAAAALDSDPQVGIAFANHLFERDGSRWTRRSLLEAGTHHHFATTLVERNPVAICASVIRRDAWHQVRPLPDTGAADLVLFGRLAEAGWAFHYIDRPLMIYRSHEEAYSAGVAFRDDGVRAWDALHFSDPAAESARRRRLARSLVSRAAGHMQSGEAAAARDDLLRARTLGHAWSRRVVLLETAARVPGAGRAGHLATSIVRILRRSSRANPPYHVPPPDGLSHETPAGN